MLEKIEHAFKQLFCALQVARVYPSQHPQCRRFIDQAYLDLVDVLNQKGDLVIGIIGDELAFEDQIFFDLSSALKQTIFYLKERAIERIIFRRGLENEELVKFITFLITPKEEIRGEVQEYLSFLGIRNIIVGKIKTQEGAAVKDEAIKAIDYLATYEDSLSKVTHSLTAALNEEDINYLALKVTMSNVMENLLGRYQEFLNFASIKRFDIGTFSHILNTSILAMFFTSHLGLAHEQVTEIGLAALFHDIGKLYLSRKIIQKPEKLTKEEFAKISSHAVLGAEILLNYTDTLGILPAVVSFEHHLGYDLSGYPKVAFQQKPHLASLIVAICDHYDALSQRRVYKNDYPPEMIYDLMSRKKGTFFEPQLFDAFFRIIGIWPVGTIVALTGQRVAVVREENPADIFSPKVEIIAPKEQKGMLDLALTKPKIKIEKSLNPLREGKPYLELI
jgi:putative nucleotidyltransferase with HDIG domain